MKTLFISLTCVIIMASCSSSRYGNANNNYASSTVSVTLNDNDNQQVYIDGQNLGNNRYNNTIQLNNVQPGQHTIEVVKSRGVLGSIFGGNNNATRTAFDVRYGYDTQLYVKSNGRVQVRQTRSMAYQNNNRRYGRYDRQDRDRNY
jgi:hypothetical protein